MKSREWHVTRTFQEDNKIKTICSWWKKKIEYMFKILLFSIDFSCDILNKQCFLHVKATRAQLIRLQIGLY